MQTIDELIDKLLALRNISDSEAFFNPPHPRSISLDALGFVDEKKVLFSVLDSIKKENKTIVVYTDYDTDGITGGAIMWETLHHLGFTVYPYVPHRHTEGYGFSSKGIDNAIAKYNPALIISVDHGISGRKEIDYIVQKGVQVIVTDHHTKPDDPPTSARAIIHCPLLSGSGLAYVVAYEIAHYFGMSDALKQKLFDYDLLALASFGIIADLVPLQGFARSIAYHGLKVVSQSSKPGIQELIKTAGISGEISAYHVGFALAPRINAVGRLSHAIDALRMLCTTNTLRARELAMQSSHFNTKRQDLVERSVHEAIVQIDEAQLPRIVVVHSETWNEGIIGLIASKLVEKWNLPAVVLTKGEDGWKGSARSIPGFDITAFLRSLHILTHVGGHPQAAGFSLPDDRRKKFLATLALKAIQLPQFDPKMQRIDADIPLRLVSLTLAERLSEWEPFGIGNPKPVFRSPIVIQTIQSMGKSQSHRKIITHSTEDISHEVEMVFFNPSPEQITLMTKGSERTCIYTVEVNEWNGKRKVVCHIKMLV